MEEQGDEEDVWEDSLDVGIEEVYFSDPCSADDSRSSSQEISDAEKEAESEDSASSISSEEESKPKVRKKGLHQDVGNRAGEKQRTVTKKKKMVEHSSTGAPMSLKTTTGKDTYTVIDYKKEKMTEAEKRNLVEVDGIRNIPDSFAWTDSPHFSQGPDVVLICYSDFVYVCMFL